MDYFSKCFEERENDNVIARGGGSLQARYREPGRNTIFCEECQDERVISFENIKECKEYLDSLCINDQEDYLGWFEEFGAIPCPECNKGGVV